MATLTIADLDNGKRDLQTVEQVANSTNDTTATRFGQQVPTLWAAIRAIGYQAPVPYSEGLIISSGLQTVEKSGVVYAPIVGKIPFTTAVWNPSFWRPVQDAGLLQSHIASPDPHPQLTESINAAVADAENARDAAIVGANIYATEADGRAATLDGQTFNVQGEGNVAVYVYRRVSSSSSTLIGQIASSEYLSLVASNDLSRFDKQAQQRYNYRGLYDSDLTYKANDIVLWQEFYYSLSSEPDIIENRVSNPFFTSSGGGWSSGPGLVFDRTTPKVIKVRPLAGTSVPGNQVAITQSSTGSTSTSANVIWSGQISVKNLHSAAVTVKSRLFLAGPGLPIYGPDVTISAGSTALLTGSGSSSAGNTSSVSLAVQLVSGLPDGATLEFSKPILTRTDSPVAYFDGDTADTAFDIFSWTGSAGGSTSLLKKYYPDEKTIGSPGGDTRWVVLLPAVDGEVNNPIGNFTGTLSPRNSNDILNHLSKDRAVGWNVNGSTLRESFDAGRTWSSVYTFTGENIESTLELDNGELLVSTAAAESYRKLYLSSGYRKGGSVTFANVLTSHAPSCKFSPWGMFESGPMVLVNEYGPKAGYTWGGGSDVIAEGNNARYCWLSLDYGKTWKVIFDLNAYLPGRLGIHLHGVAYDKWWDRVWITYGDGTHRSDGQGGSGTLYSDDLGLTWRVAFRLEPTDPIPASGTHQNVFIYPMDNFILFGTDCWPNGVQRIDRAHGKHAGTYPIDVAFDIDTETDRLAYLCHSVRRADSSPNSILLFAFGCETLSKPSVLVGTRDGLSFKKLWVDSEAQPVGYGLRSAIGPTRTGELIARHDDRRVTGQWSEIRGAWPE